MQPAQCDIKIYRGDYFEMTLRLRSGVLNPGLGTYTPGDYLNLTGWLGEAQIRATQDSTTVLAAFDVEILNQSMPQTLGGVHLSLSDEESAALSAATAVWDFQLTEPYGADERVHTYLRGKVSIDKDVTR